MLQSAALKALNIYTILDNVIRYTYPGRCTECLSGVNRLVVNLTNTISSAA